LPPPFDLQKTAIAVSYCKRGRGLIKINGVPIELVQPECLQYKVMRVSLHPGACRR
jgi:small subunit ribosomal protein S16e